MLKYDLASYVGPLADGMFVDVYTWIEAFKDPLIIPMEGRFRHAEALARRYQPAVLLCDDESVSGEYLECLEEYLGKQIRVFTHVNQLIKWGCKVWFSIAVDAPTPRLTEMVGKITRVAIVHDIIASTNHFGRKSRRAFVFGATNNDLFLPVSRVTERLFVDYCRTELYTDPTCLAYSGFHWYNESLLDQPIGISHNYALGVGTIDSRKNTFVNAAVANYAADTAYWHVGEMRDPNAYPDLVSALATGWMTYFGYLPDTLMDDIWRRALVYINLSSVEGFSLCPLEAILWGCPRLILSAIPAHEELYGGGTQTTFIGLDTIKEIKDLGTDTDEAAELIEKIDAPSYSAEYCEKTQYEYFHRYKVLKVLYEMETELAEQLC